MTLPSSQHRNRYHTSTFKFLSSLLPVAIFAGSQIIPGAKAAWPDHQVSILDDLLYESPLVSDVANNIQIFASCGERDGTRASAQWIRVVSTFLFLMLVISDRDTFYIGIP
jgi:hypothetical protein